VGKKRLKIIAIVQARIGSNRFPQKVLAEINKQPMILRQLSRIARSKIIQEIIVAIPEGIQDSELARILEESGYRVIRGSESNVLDRFLKVITESEPDICIRLTADCPLVMPEIVDEMLEEFVRLKPDYLSNTVHPTFPDGLDVEIFTPGALINLSRLQLKEYEKEHVTIGFHNRQDQFQVVNFQAIENRSSFRWTVDYEEDLPFVREVYGHFAGSEDIFGYRDVLDWMEGSKEHESLMSSHERNESLTKQRDGLLDEI
jgi:spore coat polysaccharide biosynthesis protein SpsF (cytidylyltransferase family)